MKTYITLFIYLLLFSLVPFLTGCGGSGSSSVSGSVYHGYSTVYHGYGAHYDDDIHIDPDDVQENRQQRQETRPERQQNVEAARSKAASMGRPAGGGRGGRR